MKNKVLIIDDDASSAKLLAFEMKKVDLVVDVVADGEAGLELALTSKYDLIVMDIMLPKVDGLSICRQLRDQGVETYITILSTRADEFDRILGLEAGADDYMAKPFSTREVMAKVKAVIQRRKKGTSGYQSTLGESRLSYKDLVVDLERFEVKIAGDLLALTLKEYELLIFMIRNKGRVLSREILLDNLWGLSFHGGTRVVDVQMCKLRDKLTPYKVMVKTIRGVGYLLEHEEG